MSEDSTEETRLHQLRVIGMAEEASYEQNDELEAMFQHVSSELSDLLRTYLPDIPDEHIGRSLIVASGFMAQVMIRLESEGKDPSVVSGPRVMELFGGVAAKLTKMTRDLLKEEGKL